MPELFVNPNLHNYFVSAPLVTTEGADRSYVAEYEAGNVILFPNLKPVIDPTFWGSLPTDKFPVLKKLPSKVNLRDLSVDTALDHRLSEIDIDSGLKHEIQQHMRAFYESIIPAYTQVFGGYHFERSRAIWRLTVTRNENMHFDTYRMDIPQHFARMFINIDTEPRIWQTSWRMAEAFRDRGKDIDDDLLRSGTASQIWIELNRLIFGGATSIWWDTNPRHIAYFNPGDVWVVDSRQVAHQIFYGRRAVSIDFFVDTETMLNPDMHYLRAVEKFRRKQLQARQIAV